MSCMIVVRHIIEHARKLGFGGFSVFWESSGLGLEGLIWGRMLNYESYSLMIPI